MLATCLVLLADRLALVLRLSLAGLVWAVAVAVLDRVCRLRGGRALRALEWNEQGAFLAVIGQPGRRLAAVADPASQRFGSWLWLLRFETAEGAFQVLLDPGVQAPAAIRQLSRRLGRGVGQGKLIPSGPKV